MGNTFRRMEKKYILDKQQYQLLLENIKDQITEDIYFDSKIHNIYFDNNDNDLIIQSLEKPIFKEKLRLRSYGIPNLDDTVYFEIKRKYKGIVEKRRMPIVLKDYYEYMQGNNKINNQVLKEIDYMIHYYHLKPSIYIAYDRYSYVAKEDKELRITFDYNLRSDKDNLCLEKQHSAIHFNEDQIIMEIKALGAMPLWLVKNLSLLNIKPASFSKYGEIYKEEKREELNYAY